MACFLCLETSASLQCCSLAILERSARSLTLLLLHGAAGVRGSGYL